MELTAEKFLVDTHLEDQSRTSYSGYVRKGYRTGRFGISSGSSKLALGTLAAIRARSPLCPFCRLVLRSVEEHPNRRSASGIEDTVCFASWEIDGREILRDSSGHITTMRARTRRIRLHWPGSEFQDSYIVLVAPDSWGSRGLFLGRPVESAGNNSSLAKRWMELCHDSHGEMCRVERGKDFENMIRKAFFGVIDVDLMCLTSLPDDGRYIALSYTWGDEVSFKAGHKNFQALRRKGGLQNVASELPRVILDAIALVQALGERYLWVDALCILQDSLASYNLNATLMDIVYGGAHLTICAADGKGADAGLRSLSSSERIFSQHIETYQFGYAEEIALMVSHLAETFIKQSHWNTRAWTFQERMLSKRCLISVHGRIYYQCRTTTMCEDIVSEHPNAGWSMELVQAPTQMLGNLATRPIQLYSTSVELYTSRQLTRPDDILAAFNGIGNFIGRTLNASLVYGLPNSHFDWALLWEIYEPNRKVLVPIEHRNLKKFPSWAWCGWTGGIMAYKHSMLGGTLVNLHEWLMEHTWIVWYIRDGHGSLRLVGNGVQDVIQAGNVPNRWQGYTYRSQAASESSEEATDLYGRIVQEPIRDCPRSEFQLTLMPEFPYSVHVDEAAPGPYVQFPDLPYLQFWTWSAWLHLTFEDPADTTQVHKLRRYGISDDKDDWCGTIVLDPGRLKYYKKEVKYEFLAISEAKDFSLEEYDSWTYYVPKERDQSEWDLYYVFLIEVDELKVARRLGLGKVFKEAFENSCEPGKQWKEFILG
ncbi:hypothetical protein MMC11_003550 [Xylographa trunciseda]|nr:hypothetical protein [Xylographa trunciseda]